MATAQKIMLLRKANLLEKLGVEDKDYIEISCS